MLQVMLTSAISQAFRVKLAGQHEPAQMLTTTFKVANVDVGLRKTMSKEEFHSRMAAAAQSGEFDLPRREGSDHVTPIPGMMATNMTRVQSFVRNNGELQNASDPELLSCAEIEGRRQALEYLRFLRQYIPGYANSELVAFGTQIGVRETRRVQGEYRLTREDVLSAKQFEDQVGLCGTPIEEHHSGQDTKWQYLPDGSCVGIPFRALIPLGLENVLVAGRCFSATHDAHASVRSMAQCMAMGQAAGTATAARTERCNAAVKASERRRNFVFGVAMPFLRTVTGDIDATTAGVCYSHEHIIIDPSFTTFCNPDFLLDSVDLACADILDFREAGGKTRIDSMPCGGGRNPVKLAQISARVGVNVVCPTGLRLQKYYPPAHWGEHLLRRP